MLSFFNFFKPARPDYAFTVLARYTDGESFRNFTVAAPTAYEACRSFDNSELVGWTRVSGASLKSAFRVY